MHIADVSHFVPAGSPLDRGAAERAFSLYVPGRVAPMLPPELSNDLCSLRPREDRLCVTVEVPFDANLELGEPAFYRSVIRSRARLTYGQAERILRGEEAAEPELEEGLRLAETVALELRRRRFARGALRVTTREVAFAFDEDGGVERAWLESEPHAHMLVEELMILANEAVGGLLAGTKAGGALPRPRAARPAGRPPSAREARRARGAHPAGARARASDSGPAPRSSPRRRASASPSTSSGQAAAPRPSRPSCCGR